MFLPENIDLGNAQKYTLTIRIKTDGFSFLIQDCQNKDCYTYQETDFSNEISLLNNIQKIIFDLNFLTENFKQVNVITVSSGYEQIPNVFFDKKLYSGFYNFTHHNKAKHILACEQALPECKSLFDIDSETYLFLTRSLYNPLFFHYSSLLIDYFSQKNIQEKKNSVFINFHDCFADIICFDKNRRFIYAQSYVKDDEKNLAYYVLNLWEKFGFDQRSDNLFIYGYSPEKEIEKLLRKYVKEVMDIGLIDQITDFGGKAQSIPLDVLTLSK